MLVSRSLPAQPQLTSAANSPQPPAPNPSNSEPGDHVSLSTREERTSAFYQGTGSTAKWLSRIDGAFVGGSLGIKAGAVVALAAGAGPGIVAFSGLGAAAGVGYLGYKLMDNASAFCGKVGRDLDQSNPDRGEAVGRLVVNAGLDLVGGDWKGAVVDSAVAGLGGAFNYHAAARG